MKKSPSALQNRRKQKNLEENLTERITFRISATEKDQLNRKADSRGIKPSQLCRLIVMRRQIPDHSPQTRRWLRDLVGMQNNINQLAHYANTIKGIDDWVLDALRFIISEVNKAKNILTNNDNNHE